MILKMIAITLTVLPLFSQSAQPLAENPLPSIDFISKEIMKKQSMLQPMLENYTHIETSKTKETNSDGKISKEETEKREVTRINGKLIRRLVMKNGLDLTSKETLEEELRIQKECNKAMQEEPSDSIKDILKYSQFTTLKRAIVHNEKVIVLDFIPKKGYKPATRFEELASKLAGQLFVDETTHEMVGMSSHLTGPVRFLVGSISIKNGSIEEETSLVNNEIRLPLKLKSKLQVRIFFSNKEIENETIFSDYQKFTIENKIMKITDTALIPSDGK